MSHLSVHNQSSAPPQSAELLAGAEKRFGFVPNLLGVFADSPAVLKGYLELGATLEESSLSPVEIQVALLAISRFNECRYCVAAHSAIAAGQRVPADVVEAIRADRPIADAKLEALRQFVTAVVDQRGWVADDDIRAFLDAGFTRAQVLEVVLAISFKTLSNYVNHIADTPLDDAFASYAWRPAVARAAS